MSNAQFSTPSQKMWVYHSVLKGMEIHSFIESTTHEGVSPRCLPSMTHSDLYCTYIYRNVMNHVLSSPDHPSVG